MNELALRLVLGRAHYALTEARRTISVDHPVQMQIESAREEIEAIIDAAPLRAEAPATDTGEETR